MPRGKSPGPSIKRTHQYEALVNEHGMSKEKAAKFSNAQAKKLNGGKTPTKKQAAKQLAAKKRKKK
jgi:hypothetical protein